MSEDKRYLGDGLYADWNGSQIILTAEDGVRITNTVYLDEMTWASLVEYVDWLRVKAKG